MISPESTSIPSVRSSETGGASALAGGDAVDGRTTGARIVSGMPAPLSGVPPRLLGIATSIVALTVLVGSMARGGTELDALDRELAGADPTHHAAASSEGLMGGLFSSNASVAELDEARGKGLVGLVALSEKYPKDPAVQRALALAHSAAGAHAVAMMIVERTVQLDPKLAEDSDVQTAVRAAALGPIDGAAAAFQVMERNFGSAGPDLLYSLLDEPKAKERAAKTLADPAVVSRASPALRIALELRAAQGCDGKKPLLERAASDGDKRAAAILAPLVAVPKGRCGFLGTRACPPPCAKIADAIKTTLQSIETRDSAGPNRPRDVPRDASAKEAP